jgi:hypothetical protein
MNRRLRTVRAMFTLDLLAITPVSRSVVSRSFGQRIYRNVTNEPRPSPSLFLFRTGLASARSWWQGSGTLFCK